MDISLINILKFKQKRAFLWWIALILFPVATLVLIYWPPVRNEDMKKALKVVLWILYPFVALAIILPKLLIGLFFLAFALGPSGSRPIVTKVGVEPPLYCTTDDFYRLTGVRFPELELADSVRYESSGDIMTTRFYEYKFVPKNGTFDYKFIKRLDKACDTDPDHWSMLYGASVDYYNVLTRSILRHTVDDEVYYRYFIYPDKEPVDRSRGRCDRMVKRSDGTYSRDWQGNFVYVEVYSDVVILRRGWL